MTEEKEYKILCYIPVVFGEGSDNEGIYTDREECLNDLEQQQLMQPENKYEMIEL